MKFALLLACILLPIAVVSSQTNQKELIINNEATIDEIASGTHEMTFQDERSEGDMKLEITGITSITSIRLEQGSREVGSTDFYSPVADGVEVNLRGLLLRANSLPSAEEDEDVALKLTFKLVDSSQIATKSLLLHFKSSIERKDTTTSLHDQILRIPFPLFNTCLTGCSDCCTPPNTSKTRSCSCIRCSYSNKKARYLILDASPILCCPPKEGDPDAHVLNFKKNNTLCKRGDNNDLIEVKSLPVRGSLGILLMNYHLDGISAITISIDGQDYKYAFGTKDLYNALSGSSEEDEKDDHYGGGAPDTSAEPTMHTLTEYLTSIYHALQCYEALNIDDYFKIQAYQTALRTVVTNGTTDISELAPVRQLIDQILYWSPQYVSLAPIAHAIPNNDEISISASIEYSDKKTADIDLGRYRTSGGINFQLGSSLFVTGLVNSSVYADSVSNASNSKELRAFIDSTSTTSVGIGLNSEIYFRTGCILAPTLNLGFFVPFEEEISPYAALGIGASLLDSNVKFNVSGGIATGKINRIAERYVDKDLSQYPNLVNEQLSQKAWKMSWYVSVGIGYNLASGKDEK